MIGGALAKPVESFPSIFPRGSLWDQFPYLLPNLFSAVCVFVGVIVGLLFLEETHAEKKLQRDRGVELGNCVMSRLRGANGCARSKCEKKDEDAEVLSLLEGDELLPGYSTTTQTETTTPPFPDPATLESATRGELSDPEKKAVGRIFTKPVVLNIVSYGILAL